MTALVEQGEQFDNIVTDPPYELGFMGKKWDGTGIAFSPRTWELALQLLQPGGHLLAFSGTRTYHRMASAIEDAGNGDSQSYFAEWLKKHSDTAATIFDSTWWPAPRTNLKYGTMMASFIVTSTENTSNP
jgi:hypothetical protein